MIKIKKYKITRAMATKAGFDFYGVFYRSTDVDKKMPKLTINHLANKVKQTKVKKAELTLAEFKKYIQSGGCASDNIKFYILNLIDAFILKDKTNEK